MRSRGIQLAAVAALLLSLGLSMVLGGAARLSYQSHGLGLGGKITKDLPPEMAVLTAGLGSFRGLFVNVLWYRATKLQEEGRFYEADTLAQALTTLLPSSPQVWLFQAWNMAYNISVATYTPQERWDWVSKGVSLLRERGIRANPTSIVLYRELGWIFFHKIGERADDAHWYYKQQLCYEWEELLGEPPDDPAGRTRLEAIQEIAAAPATLAGLEQEQPVARELLRRADELGYGPDESLARAIGRVRMLRSSVDIKLLGLDLARLNYDAKLAAVLDDPAVAAGVEPVLAHLRRRALEDHYNMDASFMAELMTPQDEGGFGYGPLDWRAPGAHSLFWSELGARRAGKVRALDQFDLFNTWRQARFSLQQIARFGRVSFDPVTRKISLAPDPRFFEPYERAFLRHMELVKSMPGREGNAGVLQSFEEGHENLLLEAAQANYLAGNRQTAEMFYEKARRLYAQTQRNKDLQTRRYDLSLDDFILVELRRDLGNNNFGAALQFIDGLMTQAILDDLAWGRIDLFERKLEFARRLHDDYNKRQVQTPTQERARMKFLPFDQLLTEKFVELMTTGQADLLTRARAWNQAPLFLRQRTYARIYPEVEAQVQAAGGEVVRMFPAPEGVAEGVPAPTPPSGATPAPANLLERK
ncbi:MAG: hypothetical protein IT442_07335 [Phycisphaeraceae bacterium]|nr:hypothetical protein [Phycisphaeraceae bacterium]